MAKARFVFTAAIDCFQGITGHNFGKYQPHYDMEGKGERGLGTGWVNICE